MVVTLKEYEMNVFKCDLCGKETYVNPPFEHVFEEKEIDGVKVKSPVTVKMKRQDMSTGVMTEVDVPKINDLKPRAIIVRLYSGSESIFKDFCVDCYNTSIKPEVVKLWNTLESVVSK